MKIKLKWVVVTISVFLLGFFVGGVLMVEANKIPQVEAPVIEEKKETKLDCFSYESAGEFLSMDKTLELASKRLNGNQVVMDLLRDKCGVLMSDWSFDVTGDGREELLITTSGWGCVSCHGQSLYVYDGDRLIFEKEGTDILVRQADMGGKSWPGFVMTTPISLFGESYSKPSHGIEAPYQYDGKREGFLPGFESIIKYDMD